MSGGRFPPAWLQEQGPDAPLLSALWVSLSGLRPIETMGLAVSGGSDSMALLHLATRIARHEAWRLDVVTVDHRLRPEAAEEAAFVAQTCATLGWPHETLAWNHDEIVGNLMDQARQARHALIADWAASRSVRLVAFGHTADDQAETVLMGLARKAGLDGLSGMRSTWRQDGVVFTRPLRDLTRADLQTYLLRHGLSWRNDPTNEDDRYTRIRARRALAALKPLGITAAGLARVADNLDYARSALTRYVAQVAKAVVRERAGTLEMDREAFLAAPFEVQRRLMIAALRWMSGASYPPRETGLNRMQSAILLKRTAMLSGCCLRVDDAIIRLSREPRAIATLSTPTDTPWDHRWHLSGPHAPDLTIRALGADGLRACKDWRSTGLPREVLIVTPAIWRGDSLVAAPLAGWPQGWTATVSPSFPATILAH